MFCILQELGAELSLLALKAHLYFYIFPSILYFGMVTFSNAFTREKSGLARTTVSVPTRTIFS